MLFPQLEQRTAAAALLVGLIWGSTNPFIRRGTLAVEAARAQQANTDKRAWQLLVTPGVLVPWLVNQLGSVLFVILLGQADISMAVPVANAISIAANAVVSSSAPESEFAALTSLKHVWHVCCAGPACMFSGL